MKVNKKMALMMGIISLLCGNTVKAEAEIVESNYFPKMEAICSTEREYEAKLYINAAGIIDENLLFEENGEKWIEVCTSEYFEIDKSVIDEDIIIEENVFSETEGQEAICEIARMMVTDGKQNMELSLQLKKEYRNPEETQMIPVLNENFFQKNEEFSSGAILKYKKGEEEIILAVADTPVFENRMYASQEETGENALPDITEDNMDSDVMDDSDLIADSNTAEDSDIMDDSNETDDFVESDNSDITEDSDTISEEEISIEAEMNSESDTLKAGSAHSYEIKIRNTGNTEIDDILLESRFSCSKIQYWWNENKELYLENGNARTYKLQPGEERIFYVTAKLTEEQSGTLEHYLKVTGKVKDSVITKEITLASKVQELIADFKVTKIADRGTALPGDLVNYQICIQNTGERTLHSVVTTEGFIKENIQAQFLPKQGVTLNHDRTKAYVKEIAPGASVTLSAVVKIPENFYKKELFNKVTVTSMETGSEVREAEAGIQISQNLTQDEQEIQAESIEQTSPQTGDTSRVEIFVIILLGSAILLTGLVWKMKGKKEH